MTVIDIPRLQQYRRSFAATAPASRELARRALNVTAAFLGLVAAAPAMAIIAIAIKLTSRGPILFGQTRVGLDRRRDADASVDGRRHQDVGGKPFTMYKFRTMHLHESDEVWARPDDPRITPLGRLLRQYRLDELPQLINVLKSDMNLVGPRPEQPKIFGRLREAIAGYHLRQRVAPGITGWAQVNASYDTCTDDVRRKLEYDLEYVARRSALEDLKILVRTIPVVVFRRGAW